MELQDELIQHWQNLAKLCLLWGTETLGEHLEGKEVTLDEFLEQSADSWLAGIMMTFLTRHWRHLNMMIMRTEKQCRQA